MNDTKEKATEVSQIAAANGSCLEEQRKYDTGVIALLEAELGPATYNARDTAFTLREGEYVFRVHPDDGQRSTPRRWYTEIMRKTGDPADPSLSWEHVFRTNDPRSAARSILRDIDEFLNYAGFFESDLALIYVRRKIENFREEVSKIVGHARVNFPGEGYRPNRLQAAENEIDRLVRETAEAYAAQLRAEAEGILREYIDPPLDDAGDIRALG